MIESMKDYRSIKLPVKRLHELSAGIVYLFGSYAEEAAGRLSDVDIGVVFRDPSIVHGNTFPVYNRLYDLFSDSFDCGNLDIILLERASLELQFDVITHGIVLFESSFEFRDNYEHRIVMLYADFKPLLNAFDQAVLSRI